MQTLSLVPHRVSDEDFDIAAHKAHLVVERARIERALITPEGRAMSTSGYDHPAACSLMEDVVSSRDESPAVRVLTELFAAAINMDSDARVAALARSLVAISVDQAVEANVECLDADEVVPKMYVVRGAVATPKVDRRADAIRFLRQLLASAESNASGGPCYESVAADVLNARAAIDVWGRV